MTSMMGGDWLRVSLISNNQLLDPVRSNISNTRKGVSSIFQTSRIGLKKRGAVYFLTIFEVFGNQMKHSV